MTTAPIVTLLTWSGNLFLLIPSAANFGATNVRVNGGGFVDFDVDPRQQAPVQADVEFVLGETYNISLAVTYPDEVITTDVVMVAGDLTEGMGAPAFGWFDGLGGTCSPSYVVAPDLAANGPETACALYALVEFYADQASFPNHPSLTYNPAFQPPEDLPLNWVYVKTPAGDESFSLIRTPITDSHKWLAPNGSVYFLRASCIPGALTRAYDFTVELVRHDSTAYGTEPPGPQIVQAFQVENVGLLGGANMGWDFDGGPLLSLVFNDTPAGELVYTMAIVTTDAVTFNQISGPGMRNFSAGMTADTDAGRIIVSAAEAI